MSTARMGHIGYNRKAVWMCDKETHKRIKKFDSILSAGEFLNKEHITGHISKVCKGIRPSAYGYFWEYA